MIADLAALMVDWSTARHAVAEFLDLCELPSHVEALCDWAYDGRSPELVLGAAPVVPVGGDLFQIDDAGSWAVLQAVAPDGENLVDLIAWRPTRPDRWCFLRGHGEALGERQLELRFDLSQPVKVYSTPLDWYRADGSGLCILKRTWEVAQRLLGCEATVIADDVDLGDWLDRELRYRPAPTVLVEESA
jgi:hypothetical protein